MTETTTLYENQSVKKLGKALSLWKTKNIAAKIIEKSKQDLDSSVMFLGRKISKKLIVPNSIEDITITAQRLCEEYMEGRLARSGIKEFVNSSESSTESEEYSYVLRNMGQILEMKYPKLYSKISTHLKLSYDSEIVVWDSFNKFGTNLFSEGITWAKIIAFYAFTAGLALDSISHGKNELPGRIVYWFGVFTMKKIAPWIQEQGGWPSIIEHFNTNVPQDTSEDEYDEEYDQPSYNWKKRMKRLFTRDTDNKIRIILLAILGMFTAYIFILYIRA